MPWCKTQTEEPTTSRFLRKTFPRSLRPKLRRSAPNLTRLCMTDMIMTSIRFAPWWALSIHHRRLTSMIQILKLIAPRLHKSYSDLDSSSQSHLSLSSFRLLKCGKQFWEVIHKARELSHLATLKMWQEQFKTSTIRISLTTTEKRDLPKMKAERLEEWLMKVYSLNQVKLRLWLESTRISLQIEWTSFRTRIKTQECREPSKRIVLESSFNTHQTTAQSQRDLHSPNRLLSLEVKIWSQRTDFCTNSKNQLLSKSTCKDLSMTESVSKCIVSQSCHQTPRRLLKIKPEMEDMRTSGNIFMATQSIKTRT